MLLADGDSLGDYPEVEHAGIVAGRQGREAYQIELQVEIVGTTRVLVAAVDDGRIQPQASAGGTHSRECILTDRCERGWKPAGHSGQYPAGGDLRAAANQRLCRHEEIGHQID